MNHTTLLVPADFYPGVSISSGGTIMVSWHPDVTEIQSLIDGELDPRARRSIEAHLEQCGRCMAIAVRLRQVADAVHAVGPARPPVDLEKRILSAVAATTPAEALTCSESIALSSAWIDGELTGEERSSFEAHVFTCERCYAALKQMERAAQVLRETPPRPAPAQLLARITTAVAAEQRAAATLTWRRLITAAAGLAAAAALVAALLIPRGEAPESFVGEAPAVAQTPAGGSEVSSDLDETLVPKPSIAEADGEASDAADTMIATAATPGTSSTLRPSTRPAHVAAPVTAPSSSDSTVTTDEGSRPPAERPPAADSAPSPQPAPAAPASVGGEEGGPTGAQPPTRITAPAPPLPPAPETLEPALEAVTSGPDAEPAPVTSELEPPTETAVAVAPRTTGPARRTTTPSVAPPPTPATAESVAPPPDDEPLRIAVVPRQRGTRTLYSAGPSSSGEAMARMAERIERVTERVNRGLEPGWDDPRIGVPLE